jgi:hypothetical protein
MFAFSISASKSFSFDFRFGGDSLFKTAAVWGINKKGASKPVKTSKNRLNHRNHTSRS